MLCANSTVVRLCNGGHHQQLLNEAILHNKLLELSHCLYTVRLTKFVDRLKGGSCYT